MPSLLERLVLSCSTIAETLLKNLLEASAEALQVLELVDLHVVDYANERVPEADGWLPALTRVRSLRWTCATCDFGLPQMTRLPAVTKLELQHAHAFGDDKFLRELAESSVVRLHLDRSLGQPFGLGGADHLFGTSLVRFAHTVSEYACTRTPRTIGLPHLLYANLSPDVVEQLEEACAFANIRVVATDFRLWQDIG
jgi:hypothetical protein